MNREYNKSDMTPFWHGLGWCLIWIGVGSCTYLCHHDTDKPIIKIENYFNSHP
jgi:hypothetical protein